VTLTAWLLRCGQAQAVRSRHRALAWERVSGSVSQPSRYEDHSSRVPQHGLRRSDGTPWQPTSLKPETVTDTMLAVLTAQ